MDDPVYLHLGPGRDPSGPALGPFKAVVIIEAPVTVEWRARVSQWLVESGCLYMSAWGLECSLWDDSVDFANLDAFAFGDIPDDKFVMTTWHEDEPLSEVLWFAGHAARHPDVTLEHVVLLHISAQEDPARLIGAFRDAQQGERAS